MPTSSPKLGLALSGGGFRASLFHIGVLARLAETDLLRSIEVISTVSGGSIVGAFYYLHLKKLLETIPDEKITSQQYIDIVKLTEQQFLEGVQQNLRVRAYADFKKNAAMISSQKFSRSDRMAELYDEYFYNRIAPTPRVCMNDLLIQPKSSQKNFNPRRHNAKRHNKAPMLVINATTLNTGRNWQFTTIGAGEHIEQDEVQYNKNMVFDAFHYTDENLPAKYRKIPLSVAVAASACVPGVFVPLSLTELYPDVTPKLVDGGVFDNQGISALLYEECSYIIASDASGQMRDDNKPGSSILSVLLRTNSVLMDRVRDEGFEQLNDLKESGIILEHVNLHLRQDFKIDMLKPNHQTKSPDQLVPSVTTYGVNGKAELALSNMRTDLDSFTDVEAYSLMFSGYAMSKQMIPDSWKKIFRLTAKKEKDAPQWKFAAMEDVLNGEVTNKHYLKQLQVGKELLWKAFRLMPWLIPIGILIGILGLAIPAAVVFVIGYLIHAYQLWIPLLYVIGAFVGLLIAVAVYNIDLLRQVWENFFLQKIAGAVVALSGSIIAKLHLWWIDPFFLRYGRVR